MTGSLALLAGAAVVAWTAPGVLRRLDRHDRDALTSLLCWLACITAVLGTTVAAVVLMFFPVELSGAGLTHVLHRCWAALHHGHRSGTTDAAAAATLALLTVITGRFALHLNAHLRAQRRLRRAHHDMLAVLGGGPIAQPVLCLDHDHPIAYSVGGRAGMVVISSALRRLPPEQMAAVLCHERAHLRGRHHLLVSLTRSLAAALPWVPLMRQAPRAVGLLVELRADDIATRAHGRHAVSGALLALAGTPSPARTLAMASTEVARRLRRLRPSESANPNRLRLIARAVSVTSCAVAPVAIGVAAFVLAC